MTLFLQPLTYKDACRFVQTHHRHHVPPQGWKWGIAVNDGIKVVGVIMVGRPVTRASDDGLTLEVTRCCTDGTKNAPSKLYGAAWKAAKSMGYHRLITYTLASEPGITLNASGWCLVGTIKGKPWNNNTRNRQDNHPLCDKRKWEITRLSSVCPMNLPVEVGVIQGTLFGRTISDALTKEG